VFVQFLSQQKTKLDGEISSLRKEVVALQIMKANYEQIVESQQNRPGPSAEVVPDSVKFEVLV
jgi:MAX-like protein X